jgi:hypothetical protein
MTKKRLESEPLLPDIESCPRCGKPVLLGDNVCQNCGYRLQKQSDWRKWLRDQPANVIGGTLFFVGVLVALASTGMENPLQFITLLLGSGLVVAGGLFYAASLLVAGDDRRKE